MSENNPEYGVKHKMTSIKLPTATEIGWVK